MLEPAILNINDNGWIDNELGVFWFKEVFELYTRESLYNNYRLILLDRHTSHITTEVIQYHISHKIVVLYLLTYITHLLQLVDVGIFVPLATAYKVGIFEISRFGAFYYIDKMDFLQIYQKVKSESISTEIN